MILALTLSTGLNSLAQTNRYALGSTTEVNDGNGVLYTPLACPVGSTAYVVQNKPDIVGAQYGNLCYTTNLLTFTFSVIHGVYSVKLHFIEQNQAVKIGTRTFNIWINDDLMKSNFDVFKKCGLLIGCQIGYPVIDNNGKIVISLLWTKYNAVISAIEIVPIMQDNVVFGCAISEACKDLLEATPQP